MLFASTSAVGGIIPLLGELREVKGFSEMTIGLVVAAGFLGSFVAQVGLSRFADLGYGRQMVTAGIGLMSVALLAMSVADTMPWWLVLRGAVGFASGLIAPGVKRAAAVHDPEQIGENLGRLVVGDMSGFLLGPIGAALIAQFFGFSAPFIALGVATLGFLPFAWRLPPDRGELDETGRKNSFDLLRIRRLQAALLLVVGYFCLIGAWESVMPIVFADRGGTTLLTGISFALFGLPMIILSPLAGKIADRVGAAKVAAIALTIIAICTSAYGFIGPLYALIAFQGLLGIADAFGFTAVQVAVSRSVPQDRQAAALGLMGGSQVLAAGLFAFPAAAIYQQTNEKTTWIVVGSLMLLLITASMLRIRGTEPVDVSG